MASRSKRSPAIFNKDIFQNTIGGYVIDIDGRYSPDDVVPGIAVTIKLSESDAKKLMQDALLFVGITPDNYHRFFAQGVNVRDNLDWLFREFE